VQPIARVLVVLAYWPKMGTMHGCGAFDIGVGGCLMHGCGAFDIGVGGC